MSEVALPKEILYTPTLPNLPADTINTSVVVSPSNGSTFGAGQLIQFDIPMSGFADPSTMYLRYKFNITQAGGNQAGWIRGTPAVSPFVKLEVILGSQVIETIMNYNMVYNMMTCLQMNIAQKVGCPNLGYFSAQGVAVVDPTFYNCNGCYFGATTSTNYTYAFPLMSLLAGAEHLLPLFAMPNVRLQFTVDTPANIITGGGVTGNTIALSNLEFCYDKISFGAGVEQMVQQMGAQQKLFIKSNSWATLSQTLTSGVVGTNELIYNARYASIRSLFTNFSGNNATYCVNGNFDSVDITANNGDLQYFIAGKAFPDRSVSTLQNKSGALMELKLAANGALHTVQAQNMSITPEEWYSIGNAADPTDNESPGKFWFGVNTEKFSTANALLSGVSTQNSPISLRMNLGTQTTQAFNITLIVLYDALIELDMPTKNATIRQ
jgi:hypothetical protein